MKWLPFLIEESGATAVEYAILVALILAMVIAGISSFGSHEDQVWGRVTTDLGGSLDSDAPKPECP